MQPSQLPPPAQMMQMITGFWTSCCVYTAAKLNIADHIAEQPLSLSLLAEKTQTDQGALYRILRALCSVGVFTQNEQNEYQNTDLGNTLRDNVPGSMKAMAIAQLGDHYSAWGDLLYSVRTGNIAFDHIHGMPIWKYYETHPDDGANFNKAMSGLTQAVIANILPVYDFNRYNNIVDIGGGNGTFLCAILRAATNSKGIVFDEPHIQAQGNNYIAQQGMEGRCSYAAGSFFETIPPGADLYMMKMILHDWDDEHSHRILSNTSTAMSGNSKLIIVEAVLPPDNAPHPGKFMDINMMAMTGGKERTEAEWKQLLGKAGLKHTGTIATHSPMFSIVEAMKA